MGSPLLWWARPPASVIWQRPGRPPANNMNFNDTENLNQTFIEYFADEMASAINIYYTPLLVILGVIGNLLSLFVFYNSKLRNQSTSQYLSALAISDTIFIIQLLPPWLNAMQVTGLFHHEYFCQIFVYISYFSCSLSAWLVMAFTVERFVAVIYPLRRNMLCTVSRARVIIGSLILLSGVLNLPVLRFAKPTRNDCNIDVNYMDQAARFNIIDTGVSFTVPLAVITVLNAWIMVGVHRLEKTRQRLSNRSSLVASSRLRVPPLAQQRVTKMLLIVSSFFVFFNLPAYSMRIIAYAYDIDHDQYNGVWGTFQQVALMFFNTNFGINFILYCMTGQNFRRALRQLLPCTREVAHHVTIRCEASTRPARASSISTSYVSNCTEATTNFTTAYAGSTPNPRRHRTMVTWKFDNSRQQQQRLQRMRQLEIQQGSSAESHEMVVFQSNTYD